MVKVAVLKNLPDVLKIHREMNQQEHPARRQKDGPDLHKSFCSGRFVQFWTILLLLTHSGKGSINPFGFSTLFPLACSRCSALPYPPRTLNKWMILYFGSGDCNIPWPSQQICMGERSKPNLYCSFCRPEKTGHIWSWNTLLLNFSITLEGRNIVKPDSSALWRI